MADSLIDMKQILDENHAQLIVDVFIESVFDDKRVLRKEVVNQFFSNCLNNIENPSTAPKTKFYTVYLLKQLSLEKSVNTKVLAILPSHKLYAALQELALKVDPKKSVSEKGKSLFPGDKDSGHNLMKCLIESFVFWGTMFPKNSKQQPSKYKKTLNRLNDDKVVLPKQFTFYPKTMNKIQSTLQRSEDKQKKESTKRDLTDQNISNLSSVGQVKQTKQSKAKYASEIKFMLNKIQTLLGIIEEEEDNEKIQRQIHSYHLKFEKDLEKLSKSQTEMLDNQQQEIVNLFIKVYGFLSQQKQLYRLHASKDDYNTYITAFIVAFENIFESDEQKQPVKKSVKTQKQQNIAKPVQTSIDNRVDESRQTNQTNESKLRSNLPPKEPSKIASDKRQNDSVSQLNKQKENEGRMDRERKNRFDDNRQIVQTIFSRLQTYSKSPHGFSSVTKSFEKDKKQVQGSRIKPLATSHFGKASKYGASSSFAKSTVKGIFLNPPNPNISMKNYQGELVVQNRDLLRLGDEVDKNQGHRRYKMCHFRQKYVLYESDELQIGFKTQQIYETVQKYDSMIELQLYFGNKTDKTINHLELFFQGDKKSLLYTNPQAIDDSIEPQSQARIDLMNIPKSVPYSLLIMHVSYNLKGNSNHISVILPNSIIKMTHHIPLEKYAFNKRWSDSVKILKSQSFKLSKYFPPDSLTNLISQLCENTAYSDFAKEGSYTDYELVCELIIQQAYQGTLKIVIRPDLTVIIQIGILENDQNSTTNFKFYLQCLQMVLRETNS